MKKRISIIFLLMVIFQIPFQVECTCLRLFSPVKDSICKRVSFRLDRVDHYSSHSLGSSIQEFTVTTYDAIFKRVLGNNRIRPSFLHAFLPGVSIDDSEVVDPHLQPFNKIQILRDLLHRDETKNLINRLQKNDKCLVHSNSNGEFKLDNKATEYFHHMIQRHDELKEVFPKRDYRGVLDFSCKLSNDEHVLVEMQINREDLLDRRLLEYVASFYSNQRKSGDNNKDIQRVIGINILGGGIKDIRHWKDYPDHFKRHYKLQEQFHTPPLYMDGIEIVQYNIMNSPEGHVDQELQDWLMYFQKAHTMSSEEVNEKIKTPEVLEAFDMSRYDRLPKDVQKAYTDELSSKNNITNIIIEERQEERKETKLVIAEKMLSMGMEKNLVIESTGLSEEEYNSLSKKD